jgi:tetratricopeptide (TPR) repeat protein
VVWAKSFESSTSTSSYALSEDKIAGELAGTLLWIYGVISSHERIKHLSTGTGDARYRCLLEAFDAIRSYEPDITNRALACLEHLTFVDPSFAEGFSFLSILYNREYLFGSDTRKIGLPGPDRILQTARRAVELTPASAHAHIVLAVVLFGRHEDIAALAAADEALSLNKYDPLVVSEYGGRLILSGQIETGMNMMLQATDDSVVRPLWHHFYLFLGNYLLGKMEAAASQANLITSNTYQLGLIARALVSARNGDHDKARQALERLVALRPAWRDNLRGQLEKFISAPAIVDRLARDLVTAGLPGKH